MKRHALVQYEDATPEVKEIYDEISSAMGGRPIPNFLKALGQNANVLRSMWAQLRYVIVEGDVPQLLKEIILFTISVNAGNRYCTALHGHGALNLDPTLTYEDLLSMAEGKAHEKLPPSFQVAINVVSRAALDSKTVADEDYDFEEQLRDEGFSESEIDELLAQAHFGVMLNTMTDVFHIEPEKPFPPVEDS
jgi:alkylhydroperoxidase family enzyme